MDLKKNIFSKLISIRSSGLRCLILAGFTAAIIGLTCAIATANYSAFNGEKLDYDVVKLKLKAGKSSLTFNGDVMVNGRKLVLITFTVQAFKFYDEEKIYMDPATLYPVMVKRDLDIFGKKEVIVEEYLENQGIVKISKIADGVKTEQTIEKKQRIDNIYCFIYRFRMRPNSKPGDSFIMHLPTKDVTIDFIDKRKVKAAGKEYDSIYLQSSPKEYEVWFDTSPEMIPLKINGGRGVGKTAMVLTDAEK